MHRKRGNNMANCDMTPAQMYLYIDTYNHSIWDRVVRGDSFDDLIADSNIKAIATDRNGQLILDSYNTSRPFFTSYLSNDMIDYNALWHIMKNSDLLLSCPAFRNTVKKIQKESFSAFMVNMAESTGKSYEDLYTDFDTVATPYYENHKSRELNTLDIEYRKNILADYKKKIEVFFDEHHLFMNTIPTTLDDYANSTGKQNVYTVSLLDLIQDRERFTLNYVADLISPIDPESDDGMGILFSKLWADIKSKKVNEYAKTFQNWIDTYKNDLLQYKTLEFPFRIEQTAKTITTPAPAKMDYVPHTVEFNKSYAQPKNYKLSHTMKKLFCKYYISEKYKVYTNIVKNGNLIFTDYNYGSLIALSIFLHLGIPSSQLDSFMALFGLGFAVGPKSIYPDSSLQEVYLKYLINNGVSYQVISSIL